VIATNHAYRPFGGTAMLARCRVCNRVHASDEAPGFSDSRTFSAMWRAASLGERALVIGAPALLVLAVLVGGALS
jgi:hypothetical protein